MLRKISHDIQGQTFELTGEKIQKTREAQHPKCGSAHKQIPIATGGEISGKCTRREPCGATPRAHRWRLGGSASPTQRRIWPSHRPDTANELCIGMDFNVERSNTISIQKLSSYFPITNVLLAHNNTHGPCSHMAQTFRKNALVTYKPKTQKLHPVVVRCAS